MNDMQNPRLAARADCQVLVVGAGPTGLVLAADLLARGVWTRIIDKGDGVNLQTRAIALHARALEVLDLMGLAERYVDHGQVVRWFSFYTDGKRRLAWTCPATARGFRSCSTSRSTRPSACCGRGSPSWAARSRTEPS